MPKWGISMEAGAVACWLVAVGDEVSAGQEIAEVETDKITGVLESSWAGIVRALLVDVDQDVPVGTVIALIAPAHVPQHEVDAAAAGVLLQTSDGAGDPAGGPVAGELDVDGRMISFAISGPERSDGRLPLVLIHGFGDDKTSWRLIQEALSADRQVVALDLPGHGASTKDVGDGSLAGLAAAVVGFLDARDLIRVHLAGHAMGGAIATMAASSLQAAGRVASLTLIAPAGYGRMVNADYLRGVAAAETRRDITPQLQQLFADPAMASRQFIDSVLERKRIDGAGAALNLLTDAMLTGSESAVDVRPAHAGVTGTCVAVWGSDDHIIPPANAAGLPREVSLHMIAGAGHMVHLEQPGAVADAIRAALGAL